MPILSKTRWFLFCEDAFSNEVVSTALHGLQTSSDFKEYLCTDEKRRYLYEVPSYSFASQMFRSQKRLNAKLTIFRAHSNQLPEAWVFEKPKKPTLASIIEKSNKVKDGQSKKPIKKSALRS